MRAVGRREKSGGILAEGFRRELGEYARALAFDAAGERIFVGDAGGDVYAFDAKGGATCFQDTYHEGGILALDVQPGGSLVATAGEDGRALLLDGLTGEVHRRIEFDAPWVERLAWSKSGDRLAVAAGRQVAVVDTNGETIATSSLHPSTVSAIAWSDSNELVTACYGRVSFWDASTGECRSALEWRGSLISMVLSPDGEIVACGSQDDTVHFWRRSSGQDSEMRGYSTKPSALAFDPTSTFLATSGSEACTVWSFADGGPEGTAPLELEMHALPVSALAFAHRSSTLASGAKDGGIVVWSVSKGRGDAIGVGLASGPVESVAFRPDDRGLAAIDSEGVLTTWRCRTR